MMTLSTVMTGMVLSGVLGEPPTPTPAPTPKTCGEIDLASDDLTGESLVNACANAVETVDVGGTSFEYRYHCDKVDYDYDYDDYQNQCVYDPRVNPPCHPKLESVCGSHGLCSQVGEYAPEVGEACDAKSSEVDLCCPVGYSCQTGNPSTLEEPLSLFVSKYKSCLPDPTIFRNGGGFLGYESNEGGNNVACSFNSPLDWNDPRWHYDIMDSACADKSVLFSKAELRIPYFCYPEQVLLVSGPEGTYRQANGHCKYDPAWMAPCLPSLAHLCSYDRDVCVQKYEPGVGDAYEPGVGDACQVASYGPYQTKVFPHESMTDLCCPPGYACQPGTPNSFPTSFMPLLAQKLTTDKACLPVTEGDNI